MDFVAPIVTPIVESLMAPIKKHLGFFFSSTNHVTKMHARLLVLNNTADGIEYKRDTNLANTQVIPNHVPGWLAEVKTINEEAENITTNGIRCFNIKLRYKAGKGSFDIIKRIDDLENQVSKITWTNEQIPLGVVVSSVGPSTAEVVDDYDGIQNIYRSRQPIFKDVLKFLEPNSKTQMMALCGMGGVGKTTMIKEINKVVEKRGMFKWVLKVVVGQKSDAIAIQQAIAQYLGEPLTETTKDARADRLEKRFKGMSEQDTKILVILDDVWEEIDLKDIGLTSPLPNCFKLLVTSRDEKVCIKMDIETSSIFKMVVLEDSEANSLFWETVRISDDDSELKYIGEDILKKCGGLPIGIKTIASALRGEKKDAWALALLCLQRYDRKDLYAITNDIFEISYNNLRKDDDKAIFVMCGLYPDDFDISIEELMRYGWGLQLFNEAYSLVEARQRTNTSVTNLIRANLLTKSNINGYVRMHDLVRAFILSNISKFKQASILNHTDNMEWPTQDTHDSCERMLLKCEDMSEFPKGFNYPNLVLLKIMEGGVLLKFPDDFYKHMQKIKVIAYNNIYRPLHSVSFQSSTNLRALCLHSCSFVDSDISFLGDLINLEVLSLSYCCIQKLPSTIRKLKKLKLLDLTGCIDLCIDDGVFQNLEKLEELYMRGSREKPVRFTNANCDELEIISRNLYALEAEFFKNIFDPKNVSFSNLQRFRISMGCLLEENSYYTNDKYSFHNTLKLVTNRMDLQESKVDELFYKTEELHLSVKDISYLEDIAMSPSEHSLFSNLKFLHVFNCVDLSHLFTIDVANGLKKLEKLTVSSCPILKSMVSLCDSDEVMELPQLVELKLHDLPNFISIMLEDDTSAMQPLLNQKVAFPKLLKLKVNGLKKLKYLWACDNTNGEEDNVSKLREIEVQGCDCLVNLFPRNPMRLLSHLEELKVNSCCSIEVLFNIDLGKIEQLRSSSNLRKIEAVELDELREVWRINEENKYGHLIRDFQAVETIHIIYCDKFRNIFTPTTASFDIGALKDIRIMKDTITYTDSEEIEGITKDDGNTSIVSFPSFHLTHTFRHLRKVNFRAIKEAEVIFEMECPSINRELVASQQPPPLPLHPYLQRLNLSYMDNLSHVWKCNNWREFLILQKHQSQPSFQNLTAIKLSHCKSIKYLFSPLMYKLLYRLKKIKIVECEAMEEVVSNRDNDDEEEEVLTTSATTLYPCLDYLELGLLDNLTQLGGGFPKFSQVGAIPWSLCQYSKKINIWCSHLLSCAIPSYVARKMQNLQEMRIVNCGSMVEVFETKDINNYGCSSSSSSSNIDQGSVPSPRTKNITMHHQLTNLKTLEICKCDILEYVFTFSTFESLKKLEDLSVSYCEAMKVIVREEIGEESSKNVVVVLPRLKSIKLHDLPNLAGFFLGMNTNFQLPSLDYAIICHCPKMMMFSSGGSIAPKLKYIDTWLGKHSLEGGLNFHQNPSPSSDSPSLCPVVAKGTPWSFHNLIEMKLKRNFNLKKIVPFSELQQLQNLEKVHVKFFMDVEEVFEVASEVTNNDTQTVVRLSKLKTLELLSLHNLKYIWKSNKWKILEFPNLTRVSLHQCWSLEHVFTTSMVGSLKQLQELHIWECKQMEVVVKIEEECDRKVSEIMLPCLKSITLKYLQSLKGFCLGRENLTLPSITPELKLVDTCFGLFHVGEDINSFIITKKQEGYTF